MRRYNNRQRSSRKPRNRKQEPNKQNIAKQFKPQHLSPKTPGQYEYLRIISANEIIICTGPAGTGKTHLAVGYAAEKLLNGEANRIVITRPLIQCGGESGGLGHLPGDLYAKMSPYLRPCMTELKLFIHPDEVSRGISNYHREAGEFEIEIQPMEYIRGRNFHNTIIVLDEAQNATYEQVRMLATRTGENSKLIMCGDVEQSDVRQSGLMQYADVIKNVYGVGIFELSEADCVRSGICARLLKAERKYKCAE